MNRIPFVVLMVVTSDGIVIIIRTTITLIGIAVVVITTTRFIEIEDISSKIIIVIIVVLILIRINGTIIMLTRMHYNPTKKIICIYKFTKIILAHEPYKQSQLPITSSLLSVSFHTCNDCCCC